MTDIHDQAAKWVARLNSDQVTRSDREAFKTWFDADPAHADAYAEHAALFANIGALSDNDEARAILLRRPARRTTLDRRMVLLGGAGIAAAAAATVVISPALGEKHLETQAGEQKRVRLADGSNLMLNTASKIRVHLDHAERRVFLDSGQVFFEVAKDAQRPFRVFVGDDEVRALGTAFDIKRIDNSAHVTLEEGRVAIFRRAGRSAVERISLTASPAPVAVLTPGNQATLSADRPVTVAAVNIEAVQAWRYGRLVLDETPLGDTVAELNRYGGQQIELNDPALARIRISGVFHVGDPTTFVSSICAAFPIRVVSQDDDTIVLGRKPA